MEVGIAWMTTYIAEASTHVEEERRKFERESFMPMMERRRLKENHTKKEAWSMLK